MAYSLNQIAEAIDAELIGDGDSMIDGITHPGSRPGPQELVVAFTKGAERAVAGQPVAAVLVEVDQPRPEGPRAYLVSPRGRVAFAKLLQLFETPRQAPPGIHPSAVVDATADIADGVVIGPQSLVGPGVTIGAGSRLLGQVSVGRGAQIGADCLLYPGARIGEEVVLGRGVIVQYNAVIGAEGFSYVTPNPNNIELVQVMDAHVRTENEAVIRMPSAGTVVLEDEVEIGANTTIDRATLGATRIGARTKIDNQVQVGHNCVVGVDCLISGQVGLSGSVKVGDRAVIAGKAGIADHRKIGENAMIGAASGLGADVPAGEVWLGYPAMRKDKKIDELLSLQRLPRIVRDVVNIKGRLAALEAMLSGSGKEKG
ncbi:MAG: UDP-3-O-(3-hydroxymyristoyl)glucosamine N-acyltransferase [Rhodospirillales bacterium]